MALIRKILIAAGGSGGHIFPAIALARTLKEENDGVEIRFLGSHKELDKRIFEKERFRFSLISANKLPYGASLAILPFLARLFFDLIKTFFMTAAYRPGVVVGFGGYVSFPAILTGRIFGIPTLVHEQNAVPGRANRALFRLADKVAVSFEHTKKRLEKNTGKKAVLTGNPIRQEMLKDDRSLGIRRFGLEASKFTILVIGGSQGAHALNEKFIKALSLIEEGARSSMQVIHITGIKDYEWAIKEYSIVSKLDHRVYSFIDRIEEAYSAADLVVTRAGASAIFEIAAFGRAMILVPYPFAMSHQSENAREFSANNAAIEIEEHDLSGEVFKDNILSLINDRVKLKSIGESARRLAIPAASNNLAREVLILGEK
ncbi:MAG: undecaprenyldiphospho-muramoylpentapeptide beta-N-acetylglucosaminyltransferase [Candidatus Omnitrophica bacterium]|nr:undecaprenyldiphospho-muramoylpentapeptide beta-N-acetylglucosaminyltransferase [Candidatus Omnitrophota bacterium]